MRTFSTLAATTAGVAFAACVALASAPAALADAPPAQGGSTPAPPPATGAPAKQASSDDPNQVICLRVEDTGSRLPSSRECHTRAQWVQLRASGMDTLGVANASRLPATDPGSPTGR